MSVRRVLLLLTGTSLSFLLALSAVEVGLRLARPGTESGFVGTAVRERTGPHKMQAVSWRGRRPPGDKEPESFRVLAIGDSFAWGSGVHAEDAWPDRLERRLNELVSEHRFEVVNWSRPGWNTVQAWQSLRSELTTLRPDLIVLGFTLNDAEPSGHRLRRELMAPLGRRSPSARPSRWLHSHSALYRLSWERVENRRQRRAFTAFYRNLFEGSAWEACQKALAGFRNRAREHSIPLLLLVFPIFDSQLDQSYAYVELHRKVHVVAEELQIEILDLLEVYRGIDARRLAVTPFTNPHPSELAHRIASDKLATHLVKKQLIPARFPSEMAEAPVTGR